MSLDFPTDLEQRLQRLADTATPPQVAAADDLERGRRGLARRRTAVAAVALVTAAVVTVGALGLTGGSDDDASPDVAGGPTTATDPTSPAPVEPPDPTVDRRTPDQLLFDWAVALAGHLDPDGGNLVTRPSNVQGGAGLGTKLEWLVPGEDGVGLVQIYVGRDAFAGSFWGYSCDRFSPPCRTVTVRGVEMRVQRVEGATAVYHQQDDGDRVFLLIDPLFGNNSLTPVADLAFPLRTLAAAVSDPALTTPTRRQVDTAAPR